MVAVVSIVLYTLFADCCLFFSQASRTGNAAPDGAHGIFPHIYLASEQASALSTELKPPLDHNIHSYDRIVSSHCIYACVGVCVSNIDVAKSVPRIYLNLFMHLNWMNGKCRFCCGTFVGGFFVCAVFLTNIFSMINMMWLFACVCQMRVGRGN